VGEAGFQSPAFPFGLGLAFFWHDCVLTIFCFPHMFPHNFAGERQEQKIVYRGSYLPSKDRAHTDVLYYRGRGHNALEAKPNG